MPLCQWMTAPRRWYSGTAWRISATRILARSPVLLERQWVRSRELSSLASYQQWRLEQWDKEVARQQEERRASQVNGGGAGACTDAKHVHVQIEYGQQDSKSVQGLAGVSTVAELLQQVPVKFPSALAALVNHDTVVNLHEPLYEDCVVRPIDFETNEGKKVFWHSSAHVLGQALEAVWQDDVRLCDGPASKDGGFFYEMFLNGNQHVSEKDFDKLNAQIKHIVKQRQRFERLIVSRKLAQDIFAYSTFKQKLIEQIPDDQSVTLYRCGPFVDLCRGPHVPHTGLLRAFALTGCSAAESKHHEHLQRVYGISFPTPAMLKDWQQQQVEAKKRDHRVIGRAQQLFLFDPLSPGCCFFLPHGTRIFNKLVAFMRDASRQRGYHEVITPLIFKKELWQTSGHLENYHDDMFLVAGGVPPQNAKGEDVASIERGDNDPADTTEFGLKPMNCPGHCQMFKQAKTYSYRDLPVRWTEFSALHRNEASGALAGLTRARCFHQDDAHIFCRLDQVQQEIQQCLALVQHVYGVLGFTFKLCLSTRPDKFMGEREQWDQAEEQLSQALDAFAHPWTLHPGDGAFYGPKIDVVVTDALHREHQCATIQLDFQLPRKFELCYHDAEHQPHAPILIHRAILGSMERMMAMLIEHTGGKWPLWLSPRQVAVLPIADEHLEYAHQVAQMLQQQCGLYVDVIDASKTLSKRIRDAQVLAYNNILVVGNDECKHQQVNVRRRGDPQHESKSLDAFLQEMQERLSRFE